MSMKREEAAEEWRSRGTVTREERVDGGRGEIAGIKKTFENEIPDKSSLYGLCGLSVDLGFTVPG